MALFVDLSVCDTYEAEHLFGTMKTFGNGSHILFLSMMNSYWSSFLQGNQLNMAVCSWYLIKSDLSSVHVYFMLGRGVIFLFSVFFWLYLKFT